MDASCGKFAHDQGLDVRPRRFLIVKIGAHVSDVRIGKADDLPGVAGIGEDFLITGETGVKNDFAAAAGAGARGAAVKNPPVLECEDGGACGYFRQWVLRRTCIIAVNLSATVRVACVDSASARYSDASR